MAKQKLEINFDEIRFFRLVCPEVNCGAAIELSFNPINLPTGCSNCNTSIPRKNLTELKQVIDFLSYIKGSNFNFAFQVDIENLI